MRYTFEQLGQIMLDTVGVQSCLNGYQTEEPEWVGRNALAYGDINADGTFN